MKNFEQRIFPWLLGRSPFKNTKNEWDGSVTGNKGNRQCTVMTDEKGMIGCSGSGIEKRIKIKKKIGGNGYRSASCTTEEEMMACEKRI